MKDEALKQEYMPLVEIEYNLSVADIKTALVQPAHNEWNAALDEAAARINNVRGFGQATQDSFAVFIKGLKK